MDEILIIVRILAFVGALGLILALLRMAPGWVAYHSTVAAARLADRRQLVLHAILSAVTEIAPVSGGARTRYIEERARATLGGQLSGAEFWTSLHELERLGEIFAYWGTPDRPGKARPRLYWPTAKTEDPE